MSTGQAAALYAALLATMSASFTLHWMTGGPELVGTVSGVPEELARSRSTAALVVGGLIVLSKGAAAFLAALLIPTAGALRGGRRVGLINAGVSALLLLWGAVKLVVDVLVLLGVRQPATELDRYALWWHLVLWDLWFVVWGVLLAVAVAAWWRAGSGPGPAH